jgi:hypothetical protein
MAVLNPDTDSAPGALLLSPVEHQLLSLEDGEELLSDSLTCCPSSAVRAARDE